MRPIGSRVVVTGGGSVSPFGAGVAPLVRGVVAGRRVFEQAEGGCVARVPQAAVAAAPFGVNAWRRLDLGSKMAAAAWFEALRSAGCAPAGGGARTRPPELPRSWGR